MDAAGKYQSYPGLTFNGGHIELNGISKYDPDALAALFKPDAVDGETPGADAWDPAELTAPGCRIKRSQGEAKFAPVVVIEPQYFLRECFRRGFSEKLDGPIETYASVEEFEREAMGPPARLLIVSFLDASGPEAARARTCVERLSALAPTAPIVVIAERQDASMMRGLVASGARGYLPLSMGLDLAIEAIRFVLAGGAYVPVEALVTASAEPADLDERPVMTAREKLVIRAIKQGKPNKVIAYELNMCESTVKVHVRHIMKKLGAKNRTAIAMAASEWLAERSG